MVRKHEWVQYQVHVKIVHMVHITADGDDGKASGVSSTGLYVGISVAVFGLAVGTLFVVWGIMTLRYVYFC